MLSLLHKIRLSVNDRKKQNFLLAAASFLLFLSAMLSIIYLRQEEETLSARIAPQVLRFHVLANSDSAADQNLKLEVKQMLIETMYEDLKLTPAATEISISKDDLIYYIESHKTDLERTAEEFMTAKGFPYMAKIQIEACYFPTKIYGDVVFPCGTYDAVRVLIGEGDGNNWWCVLYPPLCFTDNATAVVPDSSKGELKNLLAEDDFRDLMKKRRVVFGDSIPAHTAPSPSNQTVTVHVRSRLFDILTGK